MVRDEKVMDAEFEDIPDDKPIAEQIKDGLDTASKFFEKSNPELSESLKEASKKVDEVKETAKEGMELAQTGKKFLDQLGKFMKKVNTARGSQEIKRDF